MRYPTYRGSEEVVYLQHPATKCGLGIRPADSDGYRYYGVGIEHLAFEVDEQRGGRRGPRALRQTRGYSIHFPPEEDRDIGGYFAFFVFDPDGMRIEIFNWPR